MYVFYFRLKNITSATKDGLEDNPVKRKKVTDENQCVICKKSLAKESVKNPIVKNPSKEGLKSILDAADIRKDDLYDLLWPVKDDILSLKQKVLFHKNCRANYTSKPQSRKC